MRIRIDVVEEATAYPAVAGEVTRTEATEVVIDADTDRPLAVGPTRVRIDLPPQEDQP